MQTHIEYVNEVASRLDYDTLVWVTQTSDIQAYKDELAKRNAAKFTPAQICWAKQHDWYYATRNDGKIVVFDRYTKDGVHFEDTLVWDKSFAELRNWAGY